MLLKYNRLSRRSFLRRAAGGIALAPFVPWLQAHGQASPPPRRVILFYWPNGISAGESSRFWPQGGETDFTIGSNEVLTDLFAAHRDHVVVLNGVTNRLRPDEYHGHETTAGELWTGYGVVEGVLGGRPEEDGYSRWAGGESVDRLMVRELAQRNGGQRPTPFGAVNLGVDWTVNTQINEAGLTSALIWDGREQPIQPEANPSSAYRTLFGSFVPSGETNPEQLRRRGLLNFLRADLGRLRATLGRADQAKLDAHLTGIRELEQRLGFGNGQGLGCEMPAQTQGVNVDRQDVRPALDAMIDIAVAALACNLTQVLTFQVGYNTWWHTLHWLDVPANGCPHHCLNHDGARDENTRGTHIAGVWGMNQFKRLIDRLRSVPEGDGTLLDNTACLFLTDFADADSHWTGNIPCVLAGGSSAWRTGRYLQFGAQSRWRAHNEVLLSLVHFLGLDHVQRVGEAGTGPLPGLV